MLNIFYGFLIISVLRHLNKIKILLVDKEGLIAFLLHIPCLWIIGFIFNKIVSFI